MNEPKPTHLDLFSGIGGFSLAFEAEGFETIGFSEIDPYASAVLRKHWPHVPNYGDVRNAIGGGYCDVITGGFPCQPFSTAGLRKRTLDDRHLWPSMLDVIKDRRPAWVLGENVPGILGVDFCDMLTDLEKEGYLTQTFIVPACAVGALHLRNRVWIIAHSESLGHVSHSVHQGSDAQIHLRKPCQFSELLADKDLWYEPEPGNKRSANGPAQTLDEMRLHAIGNSIVPQVAQVFAKAIRQLI